MTKTVITRFAPSPTGFLHIGGARTALFNWLYAKHTCGKFLLRIEDTDLARSTNEATSAIYKGLEWLQLEWDDEAISQANNIERHQKIAEGLLKDDLAYRCYATQQEILEYQNKARENGVSTVFKSPWRDSTQLSASNKKAHARNPLSYPCCASSFVANLLPVPHVWWTPLTLSILYNLVFK